MPVKGLQRRKTVSEILVERKLVTPEQIKAAEETARKNKTPLEQSLIDTKILTKPKLLKALSEEWQAKAVDLSQIEADPEVAKIVPEAVARRYPILPFAKEESILFVAMADPSDFFAIEDLQLKTGLTLKPCLALPQDIIAALNGIYAPKSILAGLSQKQATPQTTAEINFEGKKNQGREELLIDPDASDVKNLVNGILLDALTKRASDIHIEPFRDPLDENKSQVTVRYRVDGKLEVASSPIDWGYREALINRIKILAKLKIEEQNVPQSGRMAFSLPTKSFETRVEVVPTQFGQSCVIRILDSTAIQLDLRTMGFLPDTLEKFMGLFKNIGGKKNYGLILVCGPTGSGKSTTLYAALSHVNRPDIKILTAENPVEYNLGGIVQVPVDPSRKLGDDKVFDFSAAMRSFLRLDPDVIMVGEIRDSETAHTAIEAAMTGHLVFSTIHTNDAPSAVARLTELKVPPFMVATSMKAVLAQRLSRKLCENCKVSHDPTPTELEIFKQNKVDLPAGSKISGPPPVGTNNDCRACGGSGFKGRIGLHELLVITDRLRAKMLHEVAADPLREEASKDGFRVLVQDGLEKVRLGVTTVAEVLGGGASA